MEARTGARIYMKLEGSERLATFEVVIEVGRKMRQGGRRQRVTSSHSRKTRRPSETVTRAQGREARDRSGRVEERQRSARNHRRVVDAM